MSNVCMAMYVSGIVQGVGFRYHTQQKARRLNLTGYAYNMDDGRVEVIACGVAENVHALIEWLKAEGPPSARVDNVLTEPRAPNNYQEFTIKHTL